MTALHPLTGIFDIVRACAGCPVNQLHTACMYCLTASLADPPFGRIAGLSPQASSRTDYTLLDLSVWTQVFFLNHACQKFGTERIPHGRRLQCKSTNVVRRGVSTRIRVAVTKVRFIISQLPVWAGYKAQPSPSLILHHNYIANCTFTTCVPWRLLILRSYTSAFSRSYIMHHFHLPNPAMVVSHQPAGDV